MKIAVLYAVPPESRKATSWHDGFTAAVDLLRPVHEVTWVNLLDTSAADVQAALDSSDAAVVKSSFGGVPDVLSRPWLARRPWLPVALVISGTGPPRRGDLRRFDVLFHETDWYRPFIADHPAVVHAFGVDTRIMRPRPELERDIDWLMVGQPASYKRPQQLLGLTGRRVLVGDLTNAPTATTTVLASDGVELIDFVPYPVLAELYARSRAVVVACELHGGGERAVLEARACGTAVRVTENNPKLAELLSGRIYDHDYYAEQLDRGLRLATTRPLSRSSKFEAHLIRTVAESRSRTVAGMVARGALTAARHRIAERRPSLPARGDHVG